MFVCSPEAVRVAVRQIERWIYASQQDTNPGIAMLHADYAVGDLDMLRQMVSDSEVIQITGRSPRDLLLKATTLQDKAQQQLLGRLK